MHVLHASRCLGVLCGGLLARHSLEWLLQPSPSARVHRCVWLLVAAGRQHPVPTQTDSPSTNLANASPHARAHTMHASMHCKRRTHKHGVVCRPSFGYQRQLTVVLPQLPLRDSSNVACHRLPRRTRTPCRRIFFKFLKALELVAGKL